MTYKEKENLLKIQNVTATMAIEGMYFNRDFLQKMMQVSPVLTGMEKSRAVDVRIVTTVRSIPAIATVGSR